MMWYDNLNCLNARKRGGLIVSERKWMGRETDRWSWCDSIVLSNIEGLNRKKEINKKRELKRKK